MSYLTYTVAAQRQADLRRAARRARQARACARGARRSTAPGARNVA
jgi:hypothetical protein